MDPIRQNDSATFEESGIPQQTMVTDKTVLER